MRCIIRFSSTYSAYVFRTYAIPTGKNCARLRRCGCYLSSRNWLEVGSTVFLSVRIHTVYSVSPTSMRRKNLQISSFLFLLFVSASLHLNKFFNFKYVWSGSFGNMRFDNNILNFKNVWHLICFCSVQCPCTSIMPVYLLTKKFIDYAP